MNQEGEEENRKEIRGKEEIRKLKKIEKCFRKRRKYETRNEGEKIGRKGRKQVRKEANRMKKNKIKKTPEGSRKKKNKLRNLWKKKAGS